MTQTSTRPQTPWIVDLPPNDIIHYGRASFMRACRGHEQMGAVLSYFVYEASWKAKNEGIDAEAENCTAITLELTQKDVLKRVNISQKTLITYLHTFEEWGFLTADGYRYTYTIHFKKIREAVACPPEPLPTKPRGKHAYSGDDRIVKLQSKLEKLQREMVKIQSEIVKLQSKNVNLQSSVVNLQSSESYESTPEQVLEGNSEAPRIIRITENLKKDLLVALSRDESSFTLEEKELSSVSSREESQAQSTESLSDVPTEVALQKDKTDTLPPAPPPSQDKTPEKRNSKKRITPIKECSPEIQARRRTWQEHFNKRRGGDLHTLVKDKTNESIGIGSLVDTFTDAQIQAIDHYLYTSDHYWSDVERRHDIDGHLVWKKSKVVREVLKERGRWPMRDIPSDDTSPPETKPKNFRTNFNEIYKQEHMAAAGARAGRMYA